MKLLLELPTWMGDTVMATPAIVNLINHYKNPEITIIGSTVSTSLIQNYEFIDKSIILNKKYMDLIRSARTFGKFDVFISFRSSYRSKFLKIFISSKNKYQFNKRVYVKGHTVERYNNFVNDITFSNNEPGKLFLKTKQKKKFIKNKMLLGLNPGASYGNSKRWYPEKFGKVAKSLSDKYDIVILGGPDEEDIANDIENYLIKNKIFNYQNLAAKTSVEELVSNIKSLNLMITGDSGPMHVAAAFEVPTVSLFGPTKYNETSQWKNKNSVVVKKNLQCQPCMKRECPLKHHNCMKLIESDEVIKKTLLFN